MLTTYLKICSLIASQDVTVGETIATVYGKASILISLI
jgi:hypothetical protein